MVRPQLSVFNFSFKNQGQGTVDVHVDGDIVDASTQEMLRDWWGDETSISFKSFRNEIDQQNPKNLNVYINSGGGHVGDAMAMHDYLQELESKGVTVNRIGRGIIASAATYLMIGKNSQMTENSMMMIHNISMVVVGDINQAENQVKAGRKFNDRIRDFYANETGNPPETITGWMNKETWMNAQEAKDRGFVKNITGQASFTNSIKAENWPYSNMAVLNAYNSFTQTNTQNMDVQKITDTINNGFSTLLEKLGLSNKKDDGNVRDAVNEFSTSITNAIKDAGAPDQDTLKNLITEAITNAFKEPSEAITNAISGANKGFVTNESLTKELNTFKETITNSVSEKLGNKTGSETRNSNAKGNKYEGRNWNE